MLKKEKLSYQGVLEDLNLSQDTLTILETVLEGNHGPNIVSLENSTKDDLDSVQTFQKLRKEGLAPIEINILASLSENLNLEGILDEVGGIDNLRKLSPNYRLKQTLTLAKDEIKDLRTKLHKLEKFSGEIVKLKKTISLLESELKTKQEVIDSINEQLSDVYILNKKLEAQLRVKVNEKTIPTGFYSTEREELERGREEVLKLRQELELMEQGLGEAAQEMEELYKRQISSLQEEVYNAVDKKQKEWEEHYAYINEQRKNEILTLQKNKDEIILKYKKKLKEKLEEIEELKALNNPILGLVKHASRWFKTIQ